MAPTVQMPIRLDRELYDDIRHEAEGRHVSMAHIIRERLRGSKAETVPADARAVKAAILDLLKTDAEVIEALKSNA